mgnify:CR=1 FL=1
MDGLLCEQSTGRAGDPRLVADLFAILEDPKADGTVLGEMLDRGVYLPPSPYEVCFLSLAHAPDDEEGSGSEPGGDRGQDVVTCAGLRAGNVEQHVAHRATATRRSMSVEISDSVITMMNANGASV